MISQTITITNTVGLHARPATIFAKAAQSFASAITLKKGEKEINAKSILKVLSLGADCGTQLEITADGTDEVIAMETLCTLLEALEG